MSFQYLQEAWKEDEDKLYSTACWENGFKLKESWTRLDMRKKFLQPVWWKTGTDYPEKGADDPSLETFKSRLGGALSDLG